MNIHVVGVNDKFTIVWYTAQGRKYRLLNRTQRSFTFADVDVEMQVHEAYNLFVLSGKSMDNYFDREIVECSINAHRQQFLTTVKKVTRVPIFVGKRTTPREYFYFIPLTSLLTKCPIEMTEQQIMQMLNIYDTFEHLTALYERHSINFKFVEVRGNKCHESDDLSGTRKGDHKTIVIGKSKDRTKTYWVADTHLIVERHYCTKYPGKCFYWTESPQHLQRHKDSCIDVPQVFSNQVWVN